MERTRYALDAKKFLKTEKGEPPFATDQAQAAKGKGLRTWSEQIELSADRVEDGRTRVHVVVHARQIVDWGSHDEVIAAIRERLSGDPVS